MAGGQVAGSKVRPSVLQAPVVLFQPLLVAGNLLLVVAPTCEEWVQSIAYKRTLGLGVRFLHFFGIEMLDPIFSGSTFCFFGFPLFSDPNRL